MYSGPTSSQPLLELVRTKVPMEPELPLSNFAPTTSRSPSGVIASWLPKPAERVKVLAVASGDEGTCVQLPAEGVH